MKREYGFVAILVLVIVALVWWWPGRSVQSLPEDQIIAADPVSPASESQVPGEENLSPAAAQEPVNPPVAAEPEPQEPLPSLNDSDALVRRYAKALVSHPVTQRVEDVQHLLRKGVTAVDLVSRQENPFSQLFFLRPPGEVKVQEEAGTLRLSEANFERYEGLVSAFEAMDDRQFIRAYRLFLPLIREAYQELANPDREWEASLRLALEEIIDAPLPPNPPELLGREGTYIFKDPRLEALPPLQKLLIRMGNDNARRVIRKAKTLRDVLESH